MMEDECNCPICGKETSGGLKDSRCHSFVKFGDDYGDNSTTFHCELPAYHVGKHQESGKLYGKNYVVQWTDQASEDAKKHGR